MEKKQTSRSRRKDENALGRREFHQLIQSGQVSGAYLFQGPEENLKAAALNALRKALLPEGLEELNESTLDNPAADAVIAACETLPFMADKRLVILRDLAGLTGRAEAEEKLVSYLPQVPDSCVLILLARGTPDGRKKIPAAMKKLERVVTFSPMTAEELDQWIIRAFQQLGKGCAPQVASLLSFTAGTDTALLHTEIEKLAALAGDRGEILESDVQAVATRSTEYNVFQMVDAVVAGQESRAFALLRDMLTGGEERLGILAMLLRQFRLMQHVLIMRYEKVPNAEIQKRLGLSPYAAEQMIRKAASYSGGAIKQAVDICLTTEYKVKSGQMNQEGSLEAAMLQIFALRRR
ncbi:MAG: DNA polymerase III subunit delta [Clostridia bacterium]|nr:DNA polymerase III subunit delta [Clostridia bacterium]